MPKAWGTVWRVNSNDILDVQDAAALTNYKVEQKISETGRGENTKAMEKSALVYSADWGSARWEFYCSLGIQPNPGQTHICG